MTLNDAKKLSRGDLVFWNGDGAKQESSKGRVVEANGSHVQIEWDDGLGCLMTVDAMEEFWARCQKIEKY